jgi:hypothetical protein
MMRNFNRKKKVKSKKQILLNKIGLPRPLGSSVKEVGIKRTDGLNIIRKMLAT